MKHVLPFVLILSSLLTSNALAISKAIYGKDNRQLSEENNDLVLKNVASSTAALINPSHLKRIDPDNYKVVNVARAQSSLNLCSDERFANQIVLANCSAVLISESTILTAGHCLNQHANKYVVFDYLASTVNSNGAMIDAKNVYKIKEILNPRGEENLDVVVAKLDRPVADRCPVRFSFQSEIANDELAIIGYPLGMPQMIAQGGKLIRDNVTTFTADLDAFESNSGSPVVNLRTGLVEGILLKGQDDFVYDRQYSCLRYRKFLSLDYAETVLKSSAVRQLLFDVN